MTSPVAVVGAGPAGLMAAETLALAGRRAVVYDASPSPARKFQLAGRGGLNLTHSEPIEEFLSRYGEAAARLRPAIAAFSPGHLRAWAAGLGEETFVGTSGRVFPKSFKATPLLRAWLRRLAGLGVELRPRHRFVGFDGPRGLRFATPQGQDRVDASAIVLALGGASWPRLGADGGWVAVLRAAGVEVAPLTPANSGIVVAWSARFRDAFAGAPLKTVALSHGGRRVRGEAVVTRYGLEGGAVYGLSADIRDTIARDGAAILTIDLKPDLAVETLAARLAPKPGQSLSTLLRKRAGLSPVAVALLCEAGPPPRGGQDLAKAIKAVPLRILASAPIDRAISSAGGIRWSEVDDDLMLRARPGVFVAGEMLDWEAPTGGYLLQACFSLGAAAGRAAAASARE